MKKTLAVLLAIAMIASFITIPASATAGEISIGDAVYPTIAEAVATAAPGDVISIGAGTYDLDSQIVLTKSVTIRGEGAATTIINGVSGGVFIVPANTVDATIDSITIEGLTINAENRHINLNAGPFIKELIVKNNVFNHTLAANVATIYAYCADGNVYDSIEIANNTFNYPANVGETVLTNMAFLGQSFDTKVLKFNGNTINVPEGSMIRKGWELTGRGNPEAYQTVEYKDNYLGTMRYALIVYPTNENGVFTITGNTFNNEVNPLAVKSLDFDPYYSAAGTFIIEDNKFYNTTLSSSMPQAINVSNNYWSPAPTEAIFAGKFSFLPYYANADLTGLTYGEDNSAIIEFADTTTPESKAAVVSAISEATPEELADIIADDPEKELAIADVIESAMENLTVDRATYVENADIGVVDIEMPAIALAAGVVGNATDNISLAPKIEIPATPVADLVGGVTANAFAIDISIEKIVNDAAPVKVEGALAAPVTLKVAIPAKFDVNTLKIYHVLDAGSEIFALTPAEGEKAFTLDGSYAVFSVASLSPFVFDGDTVEETAVFTLNSDAVDVFPGQQVAIDVYANSNTSSLIDAFQFDVAYDTDALEYVGTSFSDGIPAFGGTPTASQIAGKIRAAYMNVDNATFSVTALPQKIATINFTVKADYAEASTDVSIVAGDDSGIVFDNAVSLVTSAADVYSVVLGSFDFVTFGNYNPLTRKLVKVEGDGSGNYAFSGVVAGRGSFFYRAEYGGYVAFVGGAETASIVTSLVTAEGVAPVVAPGQVSLGDTRVDTLDATLAYRIYNGTYLDAATDAQLLNADYYFNDSGEGSITSNFNVDVQDAQQIVLAYLAALS